MGRPAGKERSMKRTKYACPRCGTVVEERWWSGTVGPECPNCGALVLDAIKGKQLLLSFSCSFFILFSGWLIRWFLPWTFWQRVALILAIGAAMIAVYYFVSRRLARPFLAEETNAE